MVRSGKLTITKVERTHRKYPINIFKKTPETFQTTSSARGCRNATAPQNSNKKITCLQKFEFILAVINRLLIGFVTIYMCWMCLRLNTSDIPFHALLCTIGFVCLMAEGLLAHYRSNAWTQLCYRTERTRTHWIMQLCGSLMGIVGIFIKIDLEELHFYTLHGQLGLGVLVLCGISMASGLVALYSNELKNCCQPLYNKAFHNIFGFGTFILAMACMYTSFETDIFLQYSLDAAHYLDFTLLLQVSIAIITFLSCYGPIWTFIYSKICRCY